MVSWQALPAAVVGPLSLPVWASRPVSAVQHPCRLHLPAPWHNDVRLCSGIAAPWRRSGVLYNPDCVTATGFAADL